MMTIYTTGLSNPFAKMAKHLGEKYMPNLVNAVQKAANEVTREWFTMVGSSSAKPGWKASYQEAIHITPGKSMLESTVSATGMYVNFVENGVKRFDMKPGLLNGKSAKTNEKGEKYAIVFMQKGAPGSQHIPPMPQEVYRVVSKADFNTSIGDVGTLGMTEDQVDKMQDRGWKSGMYSGLTKTRRAGQTQYGTFRIVTQKSPGWMYPGAPKNAIFDRMTRIMGPRVQSLLTKGFMKDMETGLEYYMKNAKEKK